jgi:tetratricopeptide (TPR) repeat protein
VDRGLAAQPLSSLPLRERPIVNVVELLAASGQPERARAMYEQMDAEMRDTAYRRLTEQARQEMLGEILLGEKKPLEAIVQFRLSDSLPDGPNGQSTLNLDLELARAFDAANKPDSSIAYYEKYLTATDPSRLSPDRDGLNLAGVLRRVGELYEARGDRSKAIASYQRFVTLWKNADQSLQPQVTDVKKKLDRLTKGVG